MRRFISYAGPKSRFACLRDRFYLPLSGVSMHLLSKFVVVVVVVGGFYYWLRGVRCLSNSTMFSSE